MTSTVLSVLNRALRQRADIYHFHDPELIPVGLFLRAFGKKVIYDMHEDVTAQIRDKAWLPGWSRAVMARTYSGLQAFAGRHFSALITANDEIAAHVNGLNDRTVTVGNYPRLEDLPLEPDFNETRYAKSQIVDFGGVGRRTCTTTVVQALSLLPQQCHARLLLAGSIESGSSVEYLSRSPGWERVDYLGKLTRSQTLSALMSASVALVLFSRNRNHLGVGSNRLFEAMAAGVAVLTSNFPKWRELIERVGCGLTVDPDDPHAIADALQYLCSNPAVCREMGLRGREAVRTGLNWDREKVKLLSVYASLLQPNAAAVAIRDVRFSE
jgi:glycosyltransferase involved in cell wall biosynthesis